MIRKVIFDQDDPEGYCFDHARALEEGLVEEMTVVAVHHDQLISLKLTDELFEELLRATELSVNVGPDEQQYLVLSVGYKYTYGDVDAIAAVPA